MKNNHVADANHPGKTALMQWLSETAPVVLPKAPSINRLLITPVLAATLIACAALLACGTEETAPEPAEERPAAQTTDSTDSRPSGSGTPNVAPDIPTPANNRQPANGGDAGSGGSSTPRPASRTEQTAAPTTTAASGQLEQPVPTDEQLEQAEHLYVKSEEYLRNQRLHRAVHALDEAVDFNPNLGEAYILRGFVRTLMRDYDAAMLDAEAAVTMEDENAARAYALRSYIHSERGNYEEALQDAEKAIETAHPEDHLARADAAVARFTAQYRSGDYGAIQYSELQNQRRRAQQQSNERLARYGLSDLYGNVDLEQLVEQLVESNTNLLLEPDDFDSYSQRYNAHQTLRWDTMALQDLNKMIELRSPDRGNWLYTQRAATWARMNDYASIVQNAESLDLSTDIYAGVLLARSHWHLEDIQAATKAIEALDYSDPAALFDFPDQLPRSTREIYGSSSDEIASHLAFKGALNAAQDNLEEALRYLRQPTCAAKSANASDEDVPIQRMVGYRGPGVLQEIARYMADDWFSSEQYDNAWRYEQDARTLWAWCDYPNELVNNPEAGLWTTLETNYQTSHPDPRDPLPVQHKVGYRWRITRAEFLDPIVMASNNPDFLHYMAAWSHAGLPGVTSVDVLREIDRSLELGNTTADAQRIKAQVHLELAFSGDTTRSLDHEERQAWAEEHYEQSVDSYGKYESLDTPEPWEAARYHFARGKLLQRLDRKQDAQAAYQQAFQLGYDEEAVKQALLELNR